jgi:hypothetical protein
VIPARALPLHSVLVTERGPRPGHRDGPAAITRPGRRLVIRNQPETQQSLGSDHGPE